MQIIKENGVPIKMWTEGVQVEELAIKQLINLSNIPFVYKHIAVMPDVHLGKGATIGSVIATKGAIIPAAVGVDIGCGMMAIKTPLNANDLPENLFDLRIEIEKSVPHGRTDNGGSLDRGAWNEIPEINSRYYYHLEEGYLTITRKFPQLEVKKHSSHHLGTLGTGNHFIELCLDQNNDLWVMLHSGSRGIGNRIGTFFIEKAKEEMQKYYIDKFLPDMDLAYLVEKSDLFDDYIYAVNWAQKFASSNRQIMMENVINVLRYKFPEAFSRNISTVMAINCHHNYVTYENHFGKNLLITRKGAVRARKDDFGIIPGSMGARSFIVRGKGNVESFHSCSHGAGRKMGRNEARKIFTLDDHIKATEGVECRKDVDVIDETPMAYKDIDSVMAAQAELVDIVYILKQILCVKG